MIWKVVGMWKEGYIFLSFAIVSEVIATSSLTASDGFTRLIPILVSCVCYATAFYCLGLTLRTIPVGIAYGIWSGVGIVLISVIGTVWFRQMLDMPAIIGLVLIIIGVLVIYFFSKVIPR